MRILLLGATGNVGQQVLKIIKKLNYELVGISFYTNTKLAITIKTKYRYSPIDLQNSNVNSYDELISKSRPNLVVNAIVGLAGLIPTLSVIKQRIDIALANKEALVVAGKFIKPLVKKNHVKIYPIDSEHAAIFKIIKEHGNNFQKIYITASGGPFYQYNRKKIQHVTYEQTIKHPKWNMGPKVSVDSSTLVNKCLELIEAFWYFNTNNIKALYHPDALIHAIVQYPKNKTYAFIANPNMLLPIEMALTKFKKHQQYIKEIDLTKSSYTIQPINTKRFLPINWAERWLKIHEWSVPIIICLADEILFNLFKRNKIKFSQIVSLISQCIKCFRKLEIKNVNDIFLLNDKCDKFINKKIS